MDLRSEEVWGEWGPYEYDCMNVNVWRRNPVRHSASPA